MEDFTFILYVGVKNGMHNEAKQNKIRYDADLKKWFIEFDYNDFVNNKKLKPPITFKAYSINILDDNIKNKKAYTDNIFKLLKERY